MALSEDDLQVACKHVCTPREYADPEVRRWAEERTRHQFAAYVRKTGVRLLDAPVGRWEKVEIEHDDGTVWVHWEYRLLGIALSA